MTEHRIPIPARVYNSAVGGHVCGPEDIDFGQKVVHLIKYDRDGNEVSFESQVTQTNKIYVIHDDFTLSSDVTIPVNCVLEFDGGSISGGTIIGNETYIHSPFGKDLVNVSKRGTWRKDAPLAFNVTFDYIVETQEDYEALFTKVNNDSKTSVNILFRNGVFSSNRADGNTFNGKQTISLYGDNATLMGKNFILKNLSYYSDGEYAYYDISEVFTSNKIANACVLDKDGNYIPYNFASFIPTEYPVVVSGTTAKIKIPSANYNFLKNKTADDFKYSYIRVNSCWNDSKAKILYSDADYIYFEVPKGAKYNNNFAVEFANNNYGYPLIRVYNLSSIYGVSMDTDKTLRIPLSEKAERLVIGYSIINFNDCVNVSISGLSFKGCAPYFNNEFENIFQAAINVEMTNTSDYKDINFTMLNCFSNGILSNVYGSHARRINSVEVSGCKFKINGCVCYNVATYEDNSIYDNIIEGLAKSFTSYAGLLNAPIGKIKIYNNEIKNFSYCGIAATEINFSTLNAQEGYIKSNLFYNEDTFLADKDTFILSDGGAIYCYHRTEDKIFEIYDNVIWNVPNRVGIYLDEGTSNVLVKSNLIYKTMIAINTNYTSIAKNPDLPQNINLNIIYNIISNRCVIHSHYDGDDSNNCNFKYNLYFGDLIKDGPFNSESRPLNFNDVSSNYFVRSNVTEKSVVIYDRYREVREKLVSSFLIMPEVTTTNREISFEEPKSFIKINTNPLRVFGYKELFITITTIVPYQELYFGLHVKVAADCSDLSIQHFPSIPNSTNEIWTAKEVNTVGRIYYNVVDVEHINDYSFKIYLHVNQVDVKYINNVKCYTFIDDCFVRGKVYDSGLSDSIEKCAMFITINMAGTHATGLTNLIGSYDRSKGRTTNRPTDIYKGYMYYDTTINKPIWWNGTDWVDATGATV